MNQQVGNPFNDGTVKNNEQKAAKKGLIFGIVAVLLVPLLMYVGAGMTYWVLNGIGDLNFCGIPLCLLLIAVVIFLILTNLKSLKSPQNKIAKIGLILSIVAAVLGIVGAILGVIDATSFGGII